MSARIRRHIRSNVVGYVALFVALSGTAYAVDGPLADQNTVGSQDIINGEVTGDDVATNAIGTAKINDRSVKNADLSTGASSSNTIADGGIHDIDVKNDTLTGTQIDEGTLFNDNSITGGDIDESTLSGVNAAGVSLPSRVVLTDLQPFDHPGPSETLLFDGSAFDIKGHCEIPFAGAIPTARVTLESTASNVEFALENAAGRSSSSGSGSLSSPPPVELLELRAEPSELLTDFVEFAAVTDSGTAALSGTVLATSYNLDIDSTTCVFSAAVLGG